MPLFSGPLLPPAFRGPSHLLGKLQSWRRIRRAASIGSPFLVPLSLWPLRASLTSATLLTLSDAAAQRIEGWQRRRKVRSTHSCHSPEGDPCSSDEGKEEKTNQDTRAFPEIESFSNNQCDKAQRSPVSQLTAEKSSHLLADEPGPLCEPQQFENPLSGAHDVRRTARMAAYGFVVYGPVLQLWFQRLDHLFPIRNAQTSVYKVAMSQSLLNPALLAFVFAYNYTLMGRTQELPEKYRRDLLPTMQRGWTFWIPASFTNFALVPLRHRVLFSSACSLLWNCHVSMASAK